MEALEYSCHQRLKGEQDFSAILQQADSTFMTYCKHNALQILHKLSDFFFKCLSA